eukprot:TRINITY_DN15550_c1_g1_i1.p1 TRINITY_DN15550_c1_g1~~TRINITY_DN15550_c1_g1_i1.p1  ORF type:complete len:599 (+),score=172.01 TRINITY_DN15550_c1_g1_i1:67-1797(+)
MAGRRVPMLSTYMPADGASLPLASEPDAQREREVRKQLQKHSKRKSSKPSRPSEQADSLSLLLVSPARDRGFVSDGIPRRPPQLAERARRWELDRDVCTSEVEYWRTRAVFCEDVVRLLQEHVELPLRMALKEARSHGDRLQAQLNVVAAQADERANALAAAESRMHKEAEGRQRDADEARTERKALLNIESLLDEIRTNGDAKVDQLTAQLSKVLSISADLEHSRASMPQRAGAQSSPSRGAARLSEELAAARKAHEAEIRTRDARIAELEAAATWATANPPAAGGGDGLSAVWDMLWQLIHDTDRQRAGIRTALGQMEQQAALDMPGHRPRAAAADLAGLRQTDFGRLRPEDRVSQLSALCAAAVDEAGMERADCVAALRRTLQTHHAVLAQRSEQEVALQQQHQLDLQRLGEVERDREEERQLFHTERTRLQQQADGLREAAGGRMGGAAVADGETQTLSEPADSWTQTAAGAGHRDASVDDGAHTEHVAELARAVDLRDARIRRLEDHRARFMSFVYSAGETGDRIRSQRPTSFEDDGSRQPSPGAYTTSRRRSISPASHPVSRSILSIDVP